MELRLIWCLLLASVLAGCRTAVPSGSAARPRSLLIAPSNSPVEVSALAHAHYSAGVVLDVDGKGDAALDEFYQASLLDPDNEVLALDLSERFVESKQPEKALQVLSKVAERPNASGEIYDHLGYVYGRLGRVDDAIAANRQAIKRSPSELTGYQNLYLNLLQKNDSAAAYQVLEQATRTGDVDAEYLVGLAELFTDFSRKTPSQKTNANVAALKILIRAADLKDVASPIKLKLADGFYLLGEERRALAVYQRLLAEYPESSSLRSNIRARLAEIYIRQDDQKHAIEQLEAMIKDDPANLAVNLQLGELALDDHQFDVAAECFRKLVLLRPGFEPTYYELAQAQLGLDKPKDALATLADARARFQASYAGELLEGIAYGRLKDYDQAIKRFTSAEVIGRASDPPRVNESFYFQFGSMYEQKGDLAQAEHYISKSLELAPDFADAQNYLGYMWADRGTNLAAARVLIEKAVSAEPTNAAYLDSLGWVLFKQGHPHDALIQEQKAIDHSELPDPTLLDHLGDILSAAGQPVKAREAWQKSLNLETNDVVRKKLGSTPAR